jgi:hypothetical protein
VEEPSGSTGLTPLVETDGTGSVFGRNQLSSRWPIATRRYRHDNETSHAHLFGDCHSNRECGMNPVDPISMCTHSLQILAERFHYHCLANNTEGSIIADGRTRNLDFAVASGHLSFLFGNRASSVAEAGHPRSTAASRVPLQ